MPPRKKNLSSMVASISLLLTSASTYAASPCYQVELGQHPRWISNATYLDGQQKLVLVDPSQDKLLAYSALGHAQELPGILTKKGEKALPVALSRLGKAGYLFEYANGTLARLDNNLHSVDEISLSQTKNAQGFQVGSMFQWKAVGDSSVIAYGTLFDGHKIEAGFFRVPLSGARAPQMLTLVPDTDFYVIGNSYITTIGDTAYYVEMSKSPGIYKVAPGGSAEKLNVVLPDELSDRPSFTEKMTGPRNAAQHFAELEKFTLISGIYSQGGQLYLLSRKADDWFLYKFDPKEAASAKGVVLSQGVRLPTSEAHHLTVLPTSTSWYLIERGPVLEGQRQVIARMDVVESPAIASAATLPISCPAK